LDNLEKVSFVSEEGETEEYYVLETATLGGANYLLVCAEQDPDEDGEALILKAVEDNDEQYTLYTTISDEQELRAVADVFECMIDDLTLE
jgi:uncharacterized protein YrzB (UPF0473 family)